MESRKLVKSGNTSFTITLPIDWVRANGLDAGSTVNVEETSEGELRLSAQRQAQSMGNKSDVEVVDTEGLDADQVRLEITIQYIRDSPNVLLRGKHSVRQLKSARETVSNLIGFEVIEQDPGAITIKNFFRVDEETSPHATSQKMFHINRAFFSLLEDFFEDGLNQQEVYEAEQFMQQNYKLSYVAEKGIFLAVQNPEMVKQLRSNTLELLKRKRYVQSSRNISWYLHNVAELFNLIDQEAAGVRELHDHFLQLSSWHDELASSIRNTDVTRLRELLLSSRRFEKDAEELVSLFEDGLLVQATTLLFAVNQEIGDMAYESLL